MNGQRPPIPGSNEPRIVARRLVPMCGRLAGGRPDVTQQGADQVRARALTLVKSDIVRYRRSLRRRNHAPIFAAPRSVVFVAR